VPGAHGKAHIAHSEGFAVCCSRRRTHGKPSDDEPYFYSRLNCGHTAKKSDGRLDGRFCRVSPCRHTAKSQCLPCSRVGHTANPLPKKIQRSKFFYVFAANGIRTHANPLPKKSNVLNFFMSLRPMGFELISSLLRVSTLSHYTTLYLVFILHFGSSNIIPNYM